jgi:adenylyl-sulfate kinase
MWRCRVIEAEGPVAPYGGGIVQALASPEAELLRERLQGAVRIELDRESWRALQLMAIGALSPLTGFMNRETYTSVRDGACLPSGLLWGRPVTLGIGMETARQLFADEEAALYYRGKPVGLIRVSDVFAWDALAEARALYGDTSLAHPSIAARVRDGLQYCVGGDVLLTANETELGADSPLALRQRFQLRGWRETMAVPIARPWQRGHEYLLRCALEQADGLVLSQPEAAGNDALPATALIAASMRLLQDGFPADRILRNALPPEPLHDTPRGQLQRAIIAQNYGCRAILIPRSARQEMQKGIESLFDRAAREGLLIRPVYADEAFHCDACGGLATRKTCPHDDTLRLRFDEKAMHTQLTAGEPLPPTMVRPEIARILSREVAMTDDAAPGAADSKVVHLHPHAAEISPELRQTLIGHRAAVLWMTGLSGSGKSTIAHRLERDLILSGHRVFVLDGDTLRHGLNRDLGFTTEDRRENLRRAAEGAKVMADAGLIVLASFISPFRAERQMVRELIGDRYHEVYVAASLETCESRDPKGLYQRARKGQIPNFTGIDSPYEAPEQAECTLDTNAFALEGCVMQLREYLVARGLIRPGRHTQAATTTRTDTTLPGGKSQWLSS